MGMRPVKTADLLAPGEAASAINTKLTSGSLKPFNGLGNTLVTFAGGTVNTIYRYGQSTSSETQFWFQFTGDVDVVKGPVDNDTEERTYWTDGTYPKKTKSDIATTGLPYPSNSYRMGLPAPTTAPSVSVSGSATNASDPAETVVYTVTYVSAWGEEGPPGPASASVSWRPGQTINLTALPTAPAGAYTITGKRIYRSAAGSQSTKYQLVNYEGDTAIATTTYNDTKATADLSTVLSTTGWVAPPDAMIGLTAMANGVLAGFTGNTVCFSEPYAPYAWPVRYQKSTDAPIVGIAAFDQSLFVGTTQGLYIFTGSDPASITSDRLAVAQSCVSKRSIVAMLGGVLFASPDGLLRISSSGIENLTEGLMSRTEWQAYVPSSFEAYESDNRYIAFYDTGTTTGGLIFSFGESSTFVTTDIYATAGFRDKKADALFLVSSNNLKKWDAGSALTMDWTSGVFHLPVEANMTAARVDAASYPVTFKLYADGALKHTQTVTSKYPFRLPAGYRSQRYQVQIQGTVEVREVEFATQMHELGAGGAG
jgi:hypothetical protein